LPTKRHRLSIALPDDLDGMLAKDAALKRLKVATRVVQIIHEHYERLSREQEKVNEAQQIFAVRGARKVAENARSKAV
jgi:hypothetical protein